MIKGVILAACGVARRVGAAEACMTVVSVLRLPARAECRSRCGVRGARDLRALAPEWRLPRRAPAARARRRRLPRGGRVGGCEGATRAGSTTRCGPTLGAQLEPLLTDDVAPGELFRGGVMSYRVAMDIGGTFTDFVVVDEDARVAHPRARRRPPRPAPSEGVLEGLAQVVPELPAISFIVHGTTVGLNAFLERKGTRVLLRDDRGAARRLLHRAPRPEGAVHPALPKAASGSCRGATSTRCGERLRWDGASTPRSTRRASRR